MSRILCIAGPTASGKSKLALDYAQNQAEQGELVELICVDSATIYRKMDIGTAKPTTSDLASCPHHLINIRDPSESYSAGEFVRDAAKLIDDIRARGAQPVLVGGTMLYFKALIHGIDELPTADLTIRADIEREAHISGWPALHHHLLSIDPVTAARLSPHDSQRISRALEVFRATGQPLSSFYSSKTSRKTLPNEVFQLIGIEPKSRQELHERISLRFDAMLKNGLIDEVQMLKARGDLTLELPSMRCVGYRQAWEYLDGKCSASEMRERGIAATRQLAKRQLTWLRSWKDKISLPQVGDTDTRIVEELVCVTAHPNQS